MDTLRDPRKPGHAALRRGRISLPGQIYHLSFTTALRLPVFAHPVAAMAAAPCFEALAPDATMLAWVLMPDHAHCLLQLRPSAVLSGVAARLKGRSARAVNQAMGRQGAVWGRAYHDRAVRADDDLLAIARYIVANPLRAGLVSRIGDWPYWNAVWLDTEAG